MDFSTPAPAAPRPIADIHIFAAGPHWRMVLTDTNGEVVVSAPYASATEALATAGIATEARGAAALIAAGEG